MSPASMPAMFAGRVVGAKYELVRLLGRGSMGQVWVAHHRTLGEDVALKLLAASSPLGGQGEQFSTSAARFLFEAQVAARLSRKTRHIVRVTDHGEEENGLAYLVMELLEGRTLEQALMQDGAMPVGEVAKLVVQIARALEQAHAENIIHRDLKPANVFITRDEDGGTLVKLLDFGIARAIRTQRIAPTFATGDGLIFGTPGYMSPEQACASKLDARCDLWALATVAYEALTGQLPVRGTSTEELLKNLQAGNIVPIHKHNPGVPLGLAAFFERSFARPIEQRFLTASQLVLAFDQAVSSKQEVSVGAISAAPPGTPGTRGDTLLAVRAPHRPFGQRRKWPRLGLLAPGALLGLALAVVAWRVPSGGSQAAAGLATASTMNQLPAFSRLSLPSEDRPPGGASTAFLSSEDAVHGGPPAPTARDVGFVLSEAASAGAPEPSTRLGLPPPVPHSPAPPSRVAAPGRDAPVPSSLSTPAAPSAQKAVDKSAIL